MTGTQQTAAVPNLAAALVKALAELTIVEAKRKASIPTKGGGSYEYDYADIADAVKATRPVLAAEGIVALTPVHDHRDGLACTVILLHTSGEQMHLGPFPFDAGRDPQATGSAVTYHRRYALIAALGMAAGDDDDGAHATARARAPQEAAPARTEAEKARDAVAARIKALGAEEKQAIRQFCIDDAIPTVPIEWSDRQMNAVIEQVAHWEAATPPDSAQDSPGEPAGGKGDPGRLWGR